MHVHAPDLGQAARCAHPSDDACIVLFEQTHDAVDEADGVLSLTIRRGRAKPAPYGRPLDLAKDAVQPSVRVPVPHHPRRVLPLELDPLVRDGRQALLGQGDACDDDDRLLLEVGTRERLSLAGLVDVAELHRLACLRNSRGRAMAAPEVERPHWVAQTRDVVPARCVWFEHTHRHRLDLQVADHAIVGRTHRGATLRPVTQSERRSSRSAIPGREAMRARRRYRSRPRASSGAGSGGRAEAAGRRASIAARTPSTSRSAASLGTPSVKSAEVR